ncbi:Cat eye syndrome critical region protein 5 [Hypsibius exemplaris]|uniref:Haloacid dehalogenase-like hydrolase domain-containing 5 n=1 Tax=Hypsibius exemplaris TaxID=2072580 RepID=A0A1W0X1Q1_HYPEX|nr:Cat eye syndrome critical region protein 5 [Hypsibius exemplaris]
MILGKLLYPQWPIITSFLTRLPLGKLSIDVRSNRGMSTSGTNHSFKKCPSFGFLFDIDGVFLRGHHPLPAGAEALKRLTDDRGRFIVPTVFVTNAGNALRREKAAFLSEVFGVKISADQIIMAHSPFSMFRQYHDRHFLVSGQGPATEIAESIGFTNVITVAQLRDRFPSLDMVDMSRRKAERIHFEHDFEKIEGVLLLGEPINWESSLQLVTDVLMTDGQPTHRPTVMPWPHLPVLACNMDLLWMAEAPLPRFGHGTFLLCLETLYKKLTGNELVYSALVGKPSEATYHHAEFCLTQQARQMGRVDGPVTRIYAVGDNPDTDVFGANLYDIYLQQKSLIRPNKLPSPIAKENIEIHTALTAGATSEIPKLLHHKPVTHDVQDIVDELGPSEHDENLAETCVSILVESGVYSAVQQQQEETQQLSYQHRDFHEQHQLVSDLTKPRFVCKNILEAVDLVYQLERFLVKA